MTLATIGDYGLHYNNFHDFKEEHPDLAKELLENVEEGDWEADPLDYYVFPSDYADYQIQDGWYADLLDKDLADMDYNGAPSLYNYIDMDSLGEDLADNADLSCVYKFENNSIIETAYGWDAK